MSSHFNSEFLEFLKNGSQLMSLPLSPRQSQAMLKHAELLVQWNRKMNLTAIKTPREIAEKHFLDCVAASSLFKGDEVVMDMGSGGGFPGIVLKVMHPGLTVLMVDAVRKKTSFLNHVIRDLQLQEIEAVHARAEVLKNDPFYQEAFDAVISRAFSDLDLFARLAEPFSKPDGKIHAMKGQQDKPDKNTHHFENFIVAADEYHLPFEKSTRHIITLSRKC